MHEQQGVFCNYVNPGIIRQIRRQEKNVHWAEAGSGRGLWVAHHGPRPNRQGRGGGRQGALALHEMRPRRWRPVNAPGRAGSSPCSLLKKGGCRFRAQRNGGEGTWRGTPARKMAGAGSQAWGSSEQTDLVRGKPVPGGGGLDEEE